MLKLSHKKIFLRNKNYTDIISRFPLSNFQLTNQSLYHYSTYNKYLSSICLWFLFFQNTTYTQGTSRLREIENLKKDVTGLLWVSCCLSLLCTAITELHDLKWTETAWLTVLEAWKSNIKGRIIPWQPRQQGRVTGAKPALLQGLYSLVMELIHSWGQNTHGLITSP